MGHHKSVHNALSQPPRFFFDFFFYLTFPFSAFYYSCVRKDFEKNNFWGSLWFLPSPYFHLEKTYLDNFTERWKGTRNQLISLVVNIREKVSLVFREFYLALFHLVDGLHAGMGKFFLGHFGAFFSTRLICSLVQGI